MENLNFKKFNLEIPDCPKFLKECDDCALPEFIPCTGRSIHLELLKEKKTKMGEME